MLPPPLQQTLADHSLWLATNGQQGRRANLRRADLQGLDLAGADLRSAIMDEAQLQNANLSGASLGEARLRDADLAGANLRGANLEGAHLRNASLEGADLEAALLWDASLPRACMSSANLRSANLSWADLQAAELTGAILDESNLLHANLRRAVLRQASLRGANLASADLTEASFHETSLRDANLRQADLSRATGLLETSLQGADLNGAQLPEGLAQFEGLANVAEAARNAGKLFVSLLLGCAFVWITLATMTDVALLTGAGSARLPLIDREIPVAYFYTAAPLVLVALSLYFHLYLQRLWELLADLPAFFPDGTPLDRKAYPWAMNSLIHAYVPRFRGWPRPPLMTLQIIASHLFAWWTVPLTLLLFWGQYLRLHDWRVTGWHVLLLAISLGMSAYYQALTRLTLQGDANALPLRQRSQLWIVVLGLIGALGIGGASLLFIHAARMEWGIVRNFVDLRDAEVSTKPAGWTGKAEVSLVRHGTLSEEEIALIKKANLSRKDLRSARANRAFLINADLRSTDLTGAALEEANLRNANLEGAILRGSDLRGADLQGAILRGVDLHGAQLQRADLRGANLQGATLDQPTTADFLRHALYDSRTEWPAGFSAPPFGALKPEPGAYLRAARLQGVDLRDADLRSADLRGAHLDGANLSQVRHLDRATLHGARYTRATLWPLDFDPANRRYRLTLVR
jgi:uncharacterized protein YjbI with pentapeptide repeats